MAPGHFALPASTKPGESSKCPEFVSYLHLSMEECRSGEQPSVTAARARLEAFACSRFAPKPLNLRPVNWQRAKTLQSDINKCFRGLMKI